MRETNLLFQCKGRSWPCLQTLDSMVELWGWSTLINPFAYYSDNAYYEAVQSSISQFPVPTLSLL
jgi:hypothetical protein